MTSARPVRKTGKWDEPDLVRRVCHALDIAKLAVEHLAANGYSNPQDPAHNIRPEKVICETAVLLLAVSPAATHTEIGKRLRRLAERLIPHARSQRMMLGLCLEAAVALDYAMPHVCLSRLGYADPSFDRLLRQALESQAHAARERYPHRMLEQEWIAAGWHGPQPHRRLASTTAGRTCILNHPMDLLNGTRDDIYAFTHALMYVSDFNLTRPSLPRRRALILAEADPLLARCLDEQDYDLSGEVLLSWPLTGRSWSASAAFGFRVLARVEDQAAFLPTPSTRISELKSLTGAQRTQYLLATAYHTAYVMGLLCAASLQPGHAPPAAIPLHNSRPDAASQILKLLDRDAQSPHWCDEFRRLNPQEAGALAGFLMDVAIRRRVQSRDFDGLHTLLKLAYDLGLAGSPAPSQAAEMLQRFATYAALAQSGNVLAAAV